MIRTTIFCSVLVVNDFKWDWLNDLKIYQAPFLKRVVNKNFQHMSGEFIEWFVGFTDGEGNFLIKIDQSKKSVSFRFQINLHLDEWNTFKKI